MSLCCEIDYDIGIFQDPADEGIVREISLDKSITAVSFDAPNIGSVASKAGIIDICNVQILSRL